LGPIADNPEIHGGRPVPQHRPVQRPGNLGKM